MTSDLDLYAQQDEREVTLLRMEERMREVELMLRNLKLLLQEKVSQLKEQVQKYTRPPLTFNTFLMMHFTRNQTSNTTVLFSLLL